MTKEQKNEVDTSEEKAEATPNEVPEENKHINWNIDKRAWIEQNNKNIKKLLELQKNNNLGTEYDDLLFKTKITDNNPSQGIIYSRIGADDAIYKLNTIERLFRDHHIDSLKDLDRLLNFAKIFSKKEKIFLGSEYVADGNVDEIDFKIFFGINSRVPILETKDFYAVLDWCSFINIAEVSGLFDKQLEKDRQDKLINKEGGENV